MKKKLMHPYLQSLMGGVLIGMASWLLLLSLGRVAGISGIASALLPPHPTPAGDRAWRWAFVAGLAVVGCVAALVVGQASVVPRAWGLLAVAGLLVGYGTVTGSGCTSGHGVCGLGRRSVRSLVATLTFMGFGMVTVAIVKP